MLILQKYCQILTLNSFACCPFFVLVLKYLIFLVIFSTLNSLIGRIGHILCQRLGDHVTCMDAEAESAWTQSRQMDVVRGRKKSLDFRHGCGRRFTQTALFQAWEAPCYILIGLLFASPEREVMVSHLQTKQQTMPRTQGSLIKNIFINDSSVR